MSTPGRTHAATINATPVANHDTRSGNTFKRGRSGCQEWPYVGSGSLGIGFSFSGADEDATSALSLSDASTIGR